MIDKKVLVGMSGGVDSSTAAFLLKEQGYEVTGVIFRFHESESFFRHWEDAQGVAEKIGILLIQMDFRKEFQEEVINYFIKEYLCGRTPNPCPVCNERMKFKKMALKADELGIKWIATGHYASIIENSGSKRLAKGIHDKKSQEYFLSVIPQPILDRILFPLSGYLKSEVRKIAEKAGLAVSQKRESQEICFIPGDDYFQFLKEKIPDKIFEGDIVTLEGKKVGRHPGFLKFTLGQRRGIGVGLGKPQYVIGIRPETNQIVVGDKEQILRKKIKIYLRNEFESIEPGKNYRVKIRYKSLSQNSKVLAKDNQILEIEAEEEFSAPTPGQLAVFYNDSDEVLAAGDII